MDEHPNHQQTMQGQAALIGPYAIERGLPYRPTNPAEPDSFMIVEVKGDVAAQARDLLRRGKVRMVAQGGPAGDYEADIMAQMFGGGSAVKVEESLRASGLPYLWLLLGGVALHIFTWAPTRDALVEAVQRARKAGGRMSPSS